MEPMVLKLMADLKKSVNSAGGAVMGDVHGKVINVKDADYKMIQALTVYGRSDQNGTPHTSYPVDIVSIGDGGGFSVSVGGKNLFDMAKLRTVVRKYNKTLLVSVLKYEGNEVTFPYTAESESVGAGMVIRCEAGKAYTFSITNPNDYVELDIAEYMNEGNCTDETLCIGYGKAVNGKSLTYTALSDGVLVCGVTSVYTDGTSYVHTFTEEEMPQVEYGTEVTDYEDYYGECLDIPLETPLYAINDSVKDKIVNVDGEWKVARRTLKVGVSKDTAYTVNEASYYSNGYRIVVNISENIGKYRKQILSNCFQTEMTDATNVATGHNAGNCFQYGTQIMFYPDMSLDEFKEWLENGNEICFIVQRASAVYESLSDSAQEALNGLHTYYGVNNISADGADIDLGYIIDTKTYIDSKFDELAKAIVATAE